MITDVATVFFGVVRVAGPLLVLAAILAMAAESVSRAGRAGLRLAHHGLSRARPSVVRRLLAGTLVPALGVAALSVSLALETEVREGPNRMVDRLQSQAGSFDPAWILQAGSSHFMNNSRLPDAVALAAGDDSSGTVHRLWEELVTFAPEGEAADTGLLLGLTDGGSGSPFSPEVEPGTARCPIVAGRCILRSGEAIADSGVYEVGTRLAVRGRTLTVVANTAEPYSLINRAVVFTGEEAFTRPDGTADEPYAVVVGGPDAAARATSLVDASGVRNGVDVVSASDIKQANATFWAGNGTPLLLLVILLSAAFCGVALYAARRSLQEQERMSTGTLQALGLRVGQVCRIDLLRSVMATGVAAVLAAPLALVLIGVTNAGMLGFHASLQPMTVLAATGMLLAANLLGTVVMYARVRSMSVIEAISAT